jgi:hypothetical protein
VLEVEVVEVLMVQLAMVDIHHLMVKNVMQVVVEVEIMVLGEEEVVEDLLEEEVQEGLLGEMDILEVIQ